jgi:hypothetical protein
VRRVGGVIGTNETAVARYGPRWGSVGLALLWVGALAFAVLLSSRGAASDASFHEDWPTLNPGIWETESKRTLPGGKVQAWKEVLSACEHQDEMLRGYWGLGSVEAAGCRYQSERTAPDEYSVTSECMVRHAAVVLTEATVKIKGGDDFEETARVVEGRKIYRGSQTGHRRSDCPSKRSAP